MEIITNEKGYATAKVNKLGVGESITFKVMREPYVGSGKFGTYTQLMCKGEDGKEFSMFIPAYMVSNGGKLFEQAKKWKVGEMVTITKLRNQKDTCNVYAIGSVLEKKAPVLKLQTATPAFTEEELDFIKQVKEAIKTIDKEVLISSIIDSFVNAGKPIDKNKAELIYAEAKK